MGRTEGSADLLCLDTCKTRTGSTWNVVAWLGNRKDKLGISEVPSIHPNSEERNKKKKNIQGREDQQPKKQKKNLDPQFSLCFLLLFEEDCWSCCHDLAEQKRKSEAKEAWRRGLEVMWGT